MRVLACLLVVQWILKVCHHPSGGRERGERGEGRGERGERRAERVEDARERKGGEESNSISQTRFSTLCTLTLREIK